MKDLYSIGETARILGVSVQTLQYYDKVNLLKPAHVNSLTGYRYYSFSQFQLIDRIKYLQFLGLSLDEIRLCLTDGTSAGLLPALKAKQTLMQQEFNEMKKKKELLDWYIDYFSYIQSLDSTEIKISRIPARYVLMVPHPEKGISCDAEIRLAQAKASANKALVYQRQYGYTLSFSQLRNNVFQATNYFIYLKDPPPDNCPEIKKFPAGEYLCFKAQVNDLCWDGKKYLSYFEGKDAPELVIANEYEDNLHNFHDSWYEVQLLISLLGEISELHY